LAVLLVCRRRLAALFIKGTSVKILIIGLDGATWRVFDESLLAGHMPNLHRVKLGGCCGVLRSTEPPITPAAWTTCITGCQPYTHGVVGFRDYSFMNDTLRISTAASCRVPTLFEVLSEQGYKAASINVPWTFPPRAINGVMICGYGMPGTDSDFTHPKELRDELLRAIPDYTVLANWEVAGNTDSEKFEQNVSRIERCFEQRVQTAKLVASKIEPDLMMVQFQNTDLVEHSVWPCLDRKTRDKYPAKRDRLLQMYGRLDERIGELLEMVDLSRVTVAVVSDHGLCGLLGIIRPNMLLHQWGYLHFKGPLRRMIRRLRRNLASLVSDKKRQMSIEMKTPVDWRRSRAMIVYPAMNGHIYVNVRGRNVNGMVGRGKEYREVIKELRRRFAEIEDPRTGKGVFARIATPDELYGKEGLDKEIVGDLVLVPKPGYIVHQTTSRKGKPLKLQPEDTLVGCHCRDGIYAFSGPNIRSGMTREAHIADITPTIYALLGIAIPSYVDGRPMQEIFTDEVAVNYREYRVKPGSDSRADRVLSDSQEEEVAKRLSALGYLD
jgi:predicted AlkP superfamily phosphohydrolase/phosphomutase